MNPAEGECSATKICTVQEMRQMDLLAMTDYGISRDLLMENAGHAVYSVIQREFGVRDRRFAVVSGPGNNGGDGFVVARKLHSSGAEVRVLVLGKEKTYSETARKNLERLENARVPVSFKPGLAEVRRALDWSEAVVDGLLGTGISRDLSRKLRDLVDEVNRARKPVISIEIPSGVNGDTGQVHGIAIQATITVTFGLPKRGNVLRPGADLAGRLMLSRISFPPSLINEMDLDVALNTFPRPPPRHPKTGRGKPGGVVFILDGTGDQDMASARMAFARLRGRPASIVAPSFLVPELKTSASAALVGEPLGPLAGGPESTQSYDLQALLEPASLVVLADGSGDPRAIRHIAEEMSRVVDVPLLVGGGALGALLPGLGEVRGRRGATVLILDPGQMAHFGGHPAAWEPEDPISFIQALSQELGSVAVLTGPSPLIARPGQGVLIQGRGFIEGLPCRQEVLMGVIAVLCDLGLSLEDAVQGGVFLHSLAMERLAAAGGEGAAGDELIQELSDLLTNVLSDFQGFLGTYREGVEFV